MRRHLAIVTTLILAAAPALALDLPTRKAGLWQVKMTFVGRKLPAQVMKQCTDAASDKLMNMNFGGSNEQNCSKQEVKPSGPGFIVDSVCKFSGTTITSHATVAGSFDSAYIIDVASTRQGSPVPGAAPSGATHMLIEAQWLGACAAGQKPGDIMMANGMTMNVIELQKMRPPVPAPK